MTALICSNVFLNKKADMQLKTMNGFQTNQHQINLLHDSTVSLVT